MLRQGSEKCAGLYRKTSDYLTSIFRSFSGSTNDGRVPNSLSSSTQSSCAASESSSKVSTDISFYKRQHKNFDNLVDTSDFSTESESDLRSSSRAPSRADSICSCFSCSHSVDVSFIRQPRPSVIITDYQVRDFYEVLDVLGEGSFSTVYLAESKLERGGFAAIKVVQKADLIKTKQIPVVYNGYEDDQIPEDWQEYQEEVEDLTWLVDREIRVMHEFDHPHIIHLEEVFEDKEVACFVMELAKGGEVFDRLVERVSFKELEAADLTVQLLCAVQHIHDQGVVHRDLKLENLLYYDDSEDSKIMVADFGLSDWEDNLEAGSSVVALQATWHRKSLPEKRVQLRWRLGSRSDCVHSAGRIPSVFTREGRTRHGRNRAEENS